MNEQPQPNNLQQDPREGGQSLYRPVAGSAPSSFSGFDLAHDARPTQPAAQQPQAPVAAPSLPAPTPAPVQAPEPVAPPVVAPIAVEADHPDDQPDHMPLVPVDLHWEASEYIHHSKNFMWYAVYVLVMLALLALAFFVTHSWTFMALVVVMATALGIYANRPPRTLHYALTNSGIQIDQSVYKYSDFRAFGIMSDGALYSVMLIPAKRFLPAVSIYFAEDDGEQIVDILGSRLPMEELHLDIIDQLVRRLRF